MNSGLRVAIEFVCKCLRRDKGARCGFFPSVWRFLLPSECLCFCAIKSGTSVMKGANARSVEMGGRLTTIIF
jgi:hypothetical protein